MSRLRQPIGQNSNRKRSIGPVQDVQSLGFETVVFPFIILLIGISLACVLLGIESFLVYMTNSACDSVEANMCKEGNNSRKIIEEISKLLREYGSKPENKDLLDQITTYAYAMSGVKHIPK